jgi:hypothetical protein
MLGFGQWFYFGIKYKGTKPKDLKISILNFRKKILNFDQG